MTAVADRLRPRAVSAFALLTLIIWTNRIWLAWTNPDDTVAEKIGWSLPITVFWICAAVILVMQFRERTSAPAYGVIVRVFGAGTILYWIIRVAVIFGGRWPLGFKIVHGILAAASIAAAAMAIRAVGWSANRT